MATLHDLDTPAVTILLDRVESNIRRVQALVAGRGMANRPHIKTHKIPAIAKMQVGGGDRHHLPEARRVEVFADAEVADDILLTFNIVSEEKTDRLMELSARVKRLAVVADNEVVVRGLSGTTAPCRSGRRWSAGRPRNAPSSMPARRC